MHMIQLYRGYNNTGDKGVQPYGEYKDTGETAIHTMQPSMQLTIHTRNTIKQGINHPRDRTYS